MGALPDDVVQCTCCGAGVIETKCPYLCKEKEFNERAEDRKFFWKKIPVVVHIEEGASILLSGIIANETVCASYRGRSRISEGGVLNQEWI